MPRTASPPRWRSPASRRLLEISDTDELMRAALTSGAQRAFESELAALVPLNVPSPDDASSAADTLSPGADELREQLSTSLGRDAFASAHARLVAVARSDGSEDDALAGGEIQTMLGEHFREALPLMLKLIFLEERTREPN